MYSFLFFLLVQSNPLRLRAVFIKLAFNLSAVKFSGTLYFFLAAVALFLKRTTFSLQVMQNLFYVSLTDDVLVELATVDTVT